jgi:hypothetical protein
MVKRKKQARRKVVLHSMSYGGAHGIALFYTTRMGWKLKTKKAIRNPKTMLYPIEFELTAQQAKEYAGIE